MPPLKLWFVRAGEGAAHVGDFLSSKLVAIGWSELGPISAEVSDDELGARFSAFYTDEKPGTRRAWQSVVRRFIRDINVGDGVMTYDPDQRLYFLGEIASGLEARKHELSRARTVNWSHQVARDELGVSTRNSLGSIATLFQVAGDARDEVWLKAVPLGVSPTPALPSAARRRPRLRGRRLRRLRRGLARARAVPRPGDRLGRRDPALDAALRCTASVSALGARARGSTPQAQEEEGSEEAAVSGRTP